MEAMVLNPVHQEQPFGLLIVLYLFLAGLSAGCFLLSSLGTVFGWDKMRPLARLAAVLAFVTFIPAPLVLIADLASPERFFMLLFRFNPTSVMAWGTWIITAYGLVSLIYAWKFWKNEEANRGLAILGTGLAAGLGLYTGMLLGVVQARPLWNSAVIPVLFLVSGLVCAGALVTLLVSVLPVGRYHHINFALSAIKAMKPVLAVAELLIIGFHLVVLALATVGARETVLNLLVGPRSVLFIWVQIVIGLVLPGLLIAFSSKEKVFNVALAGLLSVVGVWTLRLNFVFGGQEVPMLVGSVPVLEIPGTHIFLTIVVLAGVAAGAYGSIARLLYQDSPVYGQSNTQTTAS